MKKIAFLIVALLFISVSVFSQRAHMNYGPIDILKYEFHLDVNDHSNTINAKAILSVLFNSSTQDFKLDLENKDVSAKGIVVDRITENGKSVSFIHKNNQISIQSSIAKKELKKLL